MRIDSKTQRQVPREIFNIIIVIFVFVNHADEPILCYQRNSFFPLSEEKRVSNNYFILIMVNCVEL